MTRPYFKLCGLHSEQDVEAARFSHADYVGFVLAESKRKVSPKEAASWLERHPLPEKKVAALFVNAPLKDIKDVVNVLSPDIIQLHGSESPEKAAETKLKVGLEVWKALPHDEDTIKRMEYYLTKVDGFVIDAKVKGAWGGTGERFDWSHVPKYVEFGKEHGIPVFIAGGVNPDNVEKLMPFQPWGIDLSSGVETKGAKDKQKLTRLEMRLNKNE
ncbi:phosphoribosylanthranilate isomerase [Alteribacillus sp. YIM 98480]|uniref:phosphoribosylanthranilate isomerase n=1 Tax=Alteribacillus sp. YIM 98480 TaxID=2606599 RepID=UPI00131DC2F5|nr:phosphoribosylanthranilate isomerase [Alteribacillus sp. YIM 98480]